MNAQYFIYTRNLDNDYKLVYSPSDDFCPTETRRFFLKQARSVINIETYTPTFDQPRWLYSKKGNLVLFGVGVMNSILNKEFCTDYTGTPVRGFFGFVIEKLSFDILPFDIAFFQSLYSKCMVPLWNCESEDFKKKGVSMDIDIKPFNSINLVGDIIALNIDTKKSTIWGDKSVDLLLRSALNTSADVSVASGLIDKAHAFDKDSAFMNALVIDMTSKEEHVYKTEKEHTDNTRAGFDNNFDGNKNQDTAQKRKKKDSIIIDESDLSCIDRIIDKIMRFYKNDNIRIELLIERLSNKMNTSRNNKETTFQENSSTDRNRVNKSPRYQRENVVNKESYNEDLKKEYEETNKDVLEKFKNSSDFDTEINKKDVNMSIPENQRNLDGNTAKFDNSLEEYEDEKQHE